MPSIGRAHRGPTTIAIGGHKGPSLKQHTRTHPLPLPAEQWRRHILSHPVVVTQRRTALEAHAGLAAACIAMLVGGQCIAVQNPPDIPRQPDVNPLSRATEPS